MVVTSWDQVIGHKGIVNLIRRQLKDNNVKDVILFHGDTGIGKSSICNLMACELVAKGDEKVFDEQIQSVAVRGESTDNIKIFNMSSIKDNDEAIKKMTSELSLGFATNGVKCILCEECQGISKLAQDSLLLSLEHLDEGVYVFFLTTEIGVLREALVGRCRSRFPLRSLNNMEVSRLINATIEDASLQFTMPRQTVVTLISYYANNQPRAAINLLSNFKPNSLVTADDLSVFMNTNEAQIVIRLVSYLYGSMIMGLDYIETLELDYLFTAMLVEVVKVSMGGKSNLVSKLDEGTLSNVMRGNDINNLIRFAIDVLSRTRVTKRVVVSAFMKNHITLKSVPEPDYDKKYYYKDVETIDQLDHEDTSINRITEAEGSVSVKSFEELLRESDAIKE